MAYEAVIGLEVHSQLVTRSKMFCACAADYAVAPPNSRVCPVCLGMPGVLPVANRQAIDYTIMTGLALHCTIPAYAKFDRKNYHYPDLMKGYQISEYDQPLCLGGYLDIVADRGPRRIGITRVHLEEDTAKLQHRIDASGESYSLVDVNRGGVPLMEIVSEPDMRTPEEARQYLMALRAILRYLGVSTGNMEEGSFRCDANVSIRPVGDTRLGAKVEVKNMNSFRSVFRAVQFEIERQTAAVAAGVRIHQETRGWVDDRGITVGQRSKEHAHDYRYFPEPDLPPLTIARDWVDRIAAALPELPEAKAARYQADLGLSAYQARLIVEDHPLAGYFEEALAAAPDRAGQIANWLINQVSTVLNDREIHIDDLKVRPAQLARLLDLIGKGTINDTIAKQVFEKMADSGDDPATIVDRDGLAQVSDSDSMLPVIEEAIDANPKPLAEYLGGKTAVVQFFFGQVMKRLGGKANAAVLRELLVERLDDRR